MEYEGRASSTLGWGERTVIIKRDGSVLVHRPTGYEPVNWQPPPCSLSLARSETSGLVINASRSQPREKISIEFRDVSLAAYGSLSDDGEFALHVTEEQMKQAILVMPSLVEEGLKPLSEEKHVTDTGFTDIYAEDREGHLVIVEIKRHITGKDAVMQLHGYLQKTQTRTDRKLRGIIVAPDIRKSAIPMMERLKIEFIKLAPEKCYTVLKSRKDTKISQFITMPKDNNNKLI